MKHGSLFSGIGGFDLASEWMGWENIFHCEWNEFGKKVLKYYWPEAISYHDITKTDFTIHRGTIDVLTGGFPCQPYSSAGKRLGKEDDRHLWPEMLRAVREIQPRYIVGENVRGLTNWNGGMVFDEVQSDLEAEGYEVLPFLLPACAVNAPHRRDRIWFIAYNNSSTTGSPRKSGSIESNGSKNNDEQKQRGEQAKLNTGSLEFLRNVTDSMRNGIDKCNSEHEVNTSKGGFDALNDINEAIMHTNCTSKQGEYIGQTGEGKFNGPNSRDGFNNFQNFPTQSPICGGDDGLPTELDGITFPKWRNESIKAAGNAIVPQVVLQIFKVIQEYDRL